MYGAKKYMFLQIVLSKEDLARVGIARVLIAVGLEGTFAPERV